MKTVTRPSQHGGTITEYFNSAGNRVKVVHTAGSNYSGKIASAESNKVK